jgi:GNAT superfamily N-acetyltransferase
VSLPTIGFDVRRATADDAEGILACLAEAFEPYRPAYTPRAYAATVLTPRTLSRRLRSMAIWVAVDRERTVIGTVAVKPVSTGHAHLRGMAVRAEHQGKGVAAALLNAALDRAQAEGRLRVTLETTEPLRRAARFYLHHGFRRTGHHRWWGGMKLIHFERDLDESPQRARRTRRDRR